MPMKTLLLGAMLAAGLMPMRPAAAVDLALVLLTDVSKSMDPGEFAMVKDGYRAAFSDPEVIAALGATPGGVAVAYVEFSGADQVAMVQGWSVLKDASSAQAFGQAVALAPRSSEGNTALAASLRQASRLLQEGGFGEARLVIDVASDHPGDGGRSATARDAAVAAGITINALPIVDHRAIGTVDGRIAYTEWGMSRMPDYYRRNVIGGPGSFMIEADDFTAFGAALKRKLLQELIAGGEKDRRPQLAPLVTAAAE